jgi:hypothetical protein
MKSNPISERGQALIVIALAAIGLFGIVALAIDGSAKFSDRRHAQNAADTAALAGALAKINGDTYWDLVALNRALDNGYDDNHVTNEVEVYSPPISGYYAGNGLYVQVIITSHVRTYFARILGINQTNNVVQAVALADEGGELFDGAAIVSLNPSPNCSGGAGSGGGSVDVGGNGNINLTGGGIFVNSSETCGYSQTSCSVTLSITDGGINSAGSAINLSGCSSSVTTDTTQVPFVIPDEVHMPDQPSQCSSAAPAPISLGGSNWKVRPGRYTSFPPNSLSNKNIVMESGIYCIDDDLTWNGNDFSSLDGTSGVTFYITSGHDFGININSQIDLNASNSGDYAGYLIILDGNESSIESCIINGGGNINMNGTIFAPYCNITINGNSTTASDFNAQVIGWDIKLNGNNTITFTYDPGDNAEDKRKIGLMR